ncbi:MAG: tRNA (adenosine(37)-N6)-threonylcarbamoyltransferase complex dimerization subunit type 1 TsaB [Treponema sp.]|jgi:tRNA threonylcarbamoyladenosine biosynthesis protein TsaB|nr:tRNA (adenosine(37)-N6)-threonylcarbamoyltransferase complex dimerization subunit type 1 TsaB [Treponema sp.]
MNILALDTAADALSIALSTGEEVWYFEADGGRRHGELLMAAIDRLLANAGIGAADLDLAACMKGPGSFTGLRIAFATAKGLALSLGIPMVSVPTLDCMAASQASWPGLVLPAIDARKGRFYTALYRGGLRLSDYLDAAPAAITAAIAATRHGDEPALLTGPAGALVREKLPPEQTGLFVDPEGKRGKARELLDILKKTSILAVSEEVFSGPLYLRKSDAELTFDS